MAELLWSTGVREDRIAALALIFFNKQAREMVDYSGLESWSREIENRELIDHMAALTGRKLEMTPRLHATVRNLVGSENPYQRRLALMTLVVASRDPAWEPGLAAMVDRLSADPEPVVQDAVAHAKARLARMKAHTLGGG
jgi:3-methyladenine DNA glycosylase AlkD